MPSPRPRVVDRAAGTPRQLVAGLVLGLFLLGQLLAQVHLAAVPHRACAEHGELVHGSTPADVTHESPPARLPAQGNEDQDGDRGAHQSDHSGHCGVVATARFQSDVLPWSQSSQAPPIRERVGHQVDGSVERDDSARYRLAPKQSPPARPV